MSENLHKIHLTSFQVIILGFAGVILSGALLLMLPWASVKGAVTPFHEALFTAMGHEMNLIRNKFDITDNEESEIYANAVRYSFAKNKIKKQLMEVQ